MCLTIRCSDSVEQATQESQARDIILTMISQPVCKWDSKLYEQFGLLPKEKFLSGEIIRKNICYVMQIIRERKCLGGSFQGIITKVPAVWQCLKGIPCVCISSFWSSFNTNPFPSKVSPITLWFHNVLELTLRMRRLKCSFLLILMSSHYRSRDLLGEKNLAFGTRLS